ncbi:hypothetical protein M011DRAFT_58749 [Sporormia fimetaria CBS 119925]|uniref:Uncharacterized protein n=1 Tax=Sporormia fimetaria CBS 119925 TaxID=1340428 RepID=A0A6A6VBX1_9PLEO|nr:hypothetical protein M011DRAFT_58749 [Sporormia fimetaria CBS 119925]
MPLRPSTQPSGPEGPPAPKVTTPLWPSQLVVPLRMAIRLATIPHRRPSCNDIQLRPLSAPTPSHPGSWDAYRSPPSDPTKARHYQSQRRSMPLGKVPPPTWEVAYPLGQVSASTYLLSWARILVGVHVCGLRRCDGIRGDGSRPRDAPWAGYRRGRVTRCVELRAGRTMEEKTDGGGRRINGR